MSGPQFSHTQSFSRKRGGGGQSVGSVLDEAERVLQYCAHVLEPRPPTLRWGMTLKELRAAHDAMIERALTKVKLKDGTIRMRRIREDRHTLGTVVSSYPVPREMIDADATGEERRRYEEWMRLNLDYLQRQFGDRLKTVIEHTDETFGHIHAFTLPDDRADVDARNLNPAFVEKRRVEAELKAQGHEPKLALKAANIAYRQVARGMGDDYYLEVGQPAGLTRYGPRRRRMSRGDWKSEKAGARAASTMALMEATQRCEAQERDLKAIETRLDALRPALDALEAFDAWQAEVAAQQRTVESDVLEDEDWNKGALRVLYGAQVGRSRHIEPGTEGTIWSVPANYVPALALRVLNPDETELRAHFLKGGIVIDPADTWSFGKALASLDPGSTTSLMTKAWDIKPPIGEHEDYTTLAFKIEALHASRLKDGRKAFWTDGARKTIRDIVVRIFGDDDFFRNVLHPAVKAAARLFRSERLGRSEPPQMPDEAVTAAVMTEELRDRLREVKAVRDGDDAAWPRLRPLGGSGPSGP